MSVLLYQIGDYVVYGVHGGCRIVDFAQRMIDRKVKNYIVLESFSQGEMRIYLPPDNSAALDKLQPLLDGETLEQLLPSEKIRQNCWISDENQRKQKYKELISAGDHVSLL